MSATYADPALSWVCEMTSERLGFYTSAYSVILLCPSRDMWQTFASRQEPAIISILQAHLHQMEVCLNEKKLVTGIQKAESLDSLCLAPWHHVQSFPGLCSSWEYSEKQELPGGNWKAAETVS